MRGDERKAGKDSEPDGERPETVDERTVVEVEFALHDSDFFLVAASDEMECEVELECLMPRSDGTVLEFLTVRGADPDRVLALANARPDIVDARRIADIDGEYLFEFISESPLAKTLSDEEAVFRRITASSGRGRLKAEIPAHIDVTRAINAFLNTYPGAELLVRRETDRRVPTVTESQFKAGLVDSLTDKQLRALRTAHATGYFEWPRDRAADEIADRLGVSTPTFSEHLRAAQRKLFDSLFEDEFR